MPVAPACAVVLASPIALPARVTLTASPVAVASLVAVIAPWFRIWSLPSPMRMPMASAVEVLVVSPAVKPRRLPLMLVPVDFDVAMAVTAPVFSMTLVPSGVPLPGVSSIWLIPTAVAVALDFASATVASPPAPRLRPTDTAAASRVDADDRGFAGRVRLGDFGANRDAERRAYADADAHRVGLRFSLNVDGARVVD